MGGEEDPSQSSDDTGHLLGGTLHGRCFRVMVRGLEMCVLDDTNTRSLIGSPHKTSLKGSVL